MGRRETLLEQKSMDSLRTVLAARSLPCDCSSEGVRGTTIYDPGGTPMPDTVRLVDYFYIEVPDKPGEGARVLSHLKAAGVYLLDIHAFPKGRRAQVVFVPSDPAAFRAAAKAAKWKTVGPKKAFVIQGDDRVGAMVDYFAKLAQAKVNVTAGDALAAGGGRFGAILWVKARDVRRAAKALGVG